MPQFYVTIERQLTAYLLVTVEADTGIEAYAQVQESIADCEGNAEALAQHYMATWDIDMDELSPEDVESFSN